MARGLQNTWLELLDGELSGLAAFPNSLVHSSISSTADEPYDFVSINDTNFALIADRSRPSINRV